MLKGRTAANASAARAALCFMDASSGPVNHFADGVAAVISRLAVLVVMWPVVHLEQQAFLVRPGGAVGMILRIHVEVAGPQGNARAEILVLALDAIHELVGRVRVPVGIAAPRLDLEQ